MGRPPLWCRCRREWRAVVRGGGGGDLGDGQWRAHRGRRARPARGLPPRRRALPRTDRRVCAGSAAAAVAPLATGRSARDCAAVGVCRAAREAP
eukprot:1445091-Prymnesium_polylepis.1